MSRLTEDFLSELRIGRRPVGKLRHLHKIRRISLASLIVLNVVGLLSASAFIKGNALFPISVAYAAGLLLAILAYFISFLKRRLALFCALTASFACLVHLYGVRPDISEILSALPACMLTLLWILNLARLTYRAAMIAAAAFLAAACVPILAVALYNNPVFSWLQLAAATLFLFTIGALGFLGLNHIERLSGKFYRLHIMLKSISGLHRTNLYKLLRGHTDVQRSLLPKNLDIPAFDISCFYVPAEDISGDYLDVVCDKDKTWVAIGDAAGKGLTAGLIVLMTQVAIRTAIASTPPEEQYPSTILRKANLVISDNIAKINRLNRFMTLSLMRIDSDGRFFYSGLHQPIFILRNSNLQFEILSGRGAWLGMSDISNDFFEDQSQLNPDDIMFLFTDGITEVTGELAGQAVHFSEITDIIRLHRHKNTEFIKLKIVDHVKKLNVSDDLSFMLLKKVA